jgi:hypothetical protein
MVKYVVLAALLAVFATPAEASKIVGNGKQACENAGGTWTGKRCKKSD